MDFAMCSSISKQILFLAQPKKQSHKRLVDMENPLNPNQGRSQFSFAD